ncbi:MAG: hypothetical protein IKT54_02430 [Clostridia bacterium]|nr:hypothetical protein [Clostridia bacterium]
MKKILALVIALTLLCAMFVSCGDNPQTLIEKADAALKEGPYAATLKFNFETDNEELNEVFSMMNMEIPTIIDGNNLVMNMSMDVMGLTVALDATIVDMVMYYDIELFGASVKMKSTMTEEQYQEFMEDSNAQMLLLPDYFSEMTVESKDGKKYITCTGLSEDGFKELNDVVAEQLESIGASAEVSEISYTLTLNKGKYESIELHCVYTVDMDGETTTFTMDMSAEYSYDNIAPITVPENADEYEEVDAGEILG